MVFFRISLRAVTLFVALRILHIIGQPDGLLASAGEEGRAVPAHVSRSDVIRKDVKPSPRTSSANQTDLVFLIDVSGSVDPSEYALQLEGFARALENPNLIPHDGTVAISVIQFARTVRIDLPLTLISSTASATSLATQIRALDRNGLGNSTAVGDAVMAATEEFGRNARPAAQQALCVSTDGLPNIGLSLDAAILNAQSAGVDEMDVIVIGNQMLISFYESHVFGGGPGVAFAQDFIEFSTLVGDKIGDVLQPTTCAVTIVTPEAGDTVIHDSVTVTGSVLFGGAMSVAALDCQVNGLAAVTSRNLFSAVVPTQIGDNLLVATCTATDPVGRSTTCLDSVSILRPAAVLNMTEITSPKDSSTIANGAVLMRTRITASGGVEPYEFACKTSVNGKPVVVAPAKGPALFLQQDKHIMMDSIVQLELGANGILQVCTVTDSLGQVSAARDSITVFRTAGSACQIDFTSPKDGEIVCDDSLLVTAALSLNDNVPILSFESDINGFPAVLNGSTIQAKIPVGAGDNTLIVRTLILLTNGEVVVCSDTATVFVDTIPPYCEFTFGGDAVEGFFFDAHSGIKVIEPVEIHNGILTVDPFQIGAKKVGFRIDLINPDKNIFFSIDARDRCRNRVNCDPVFLTLSMDSEVTRHTFSFPAVDRFFEIKNEGLAEVNVDLNGQRFRLLSDQRKAQITDNSYFMPEQGVVTLDLGPHLATGENVMTLTLSGPAGTGGQLTISNEADRVDYVLDLQTLPEQFQLSQNFPNPFNPSTRIEYEIPARLDADTHVQLRVFNLLGELVRVLVDEEKRPGQHMVEWDGRDGNGRDVASGVYIYQLTAPDLRRARRMLLLR